MSMKSLTLIAGLIAVSPSGSFAQSACGSFSCDYYRYMDNQQRDLDWAFQQQQMREEQRRIDEQLAEQRRQLQELRSNQQLLSPQYQTSPYR
jgi:hypothetical protein